MHEKTVLLDTAKASLPIGGGIALQWMHVADQLIMLGTHLVGFVAAIAGAWWYIRRLRRDLKESK